MDILYLLIPLSVMLVLLILGGLWWALYHGQFESVEQEGELMLQDGLLLSMPDSLDCNNL